MVYSLSRFSGSLSLLRSNLRTFLPWQTRSMSFSFAEQTNLSGSAFSSGLHRPRAREQELAGLLIVDGL